MNMKKTLMAAVVLLGGIAMAADNSYSFTYQAALRDEHGLVISNGTAVARNQTVTLRLWDAATGGNLLWGRTYNVYTDETGLFNLEVSDLAGSPANDAPAGATLESVFTKNRAGDVHIGLFVKGSSGEIVPRQRLFAVPFAAVANDVRQISGDITVGGNITMKNGAKSGVVISADGISQESGSSTFQNVVANDTVTASGKITTVGGLEVNGGVVKINVPVTVKGNNLAVADGKLIVGGSEVVPVPVGGIIMWTKKDLPDTTHWAICDGKNGTPDLRSRFVVGAGSSYGVGDTGGEDKHLLTEKEMPTHYHHLGNNDWWRVSVDDETDYYFYVPKAEPGKHGVSGSYGWDSNGDTASVGGNDYHENRPPYYALYYIMRIQ